MGSQNNNFAIPAYRVEMMMRKYIANHKTYSAVHCDSKPETCMLKVPPLGATAVKGNDKLYRHYNCAPGDGAFLSKVDKRGAFHAADPPITENSFITKVNDIKL